MAISIISNKDYQNNNYRINAGRFVTDMAVVSTLAIYATVTEAGNIPEAYYLGLSSGGHAIKWEVTPTIGNYFIYKAPAYNCATITNGVYYSNIGTDGYWFSAGTLMSDPNYTVASWVDPDTLIVGGRGSTGSPTISGVKPCLIVPTAGESANIGTSANPIYVSSVSSKSFTVYTLSGGAESVRLTMGLPPTAVVTVTVSGRDGSIATTNQMIEYFELDGTLLATNNVADQWYITVSGSMYPYQFPFRTWPLGWIMPSTTESMTAAFVHRTSAAVVSAYDYQAPEQYPLSAIPSDVFSVEYMRFYFTEPGRKYITFGVWKDPTKPLDLSNTLATYTFTSRFFNNVDALRVKLVDTDYSVLPYTLRLSAVSLYDNNTNEIYLDSSYPDIRWDWPGTNLTVTTVKTGATVVKNTPMDATIGDFIRIRTSQDGIYPLTASTATATAFYTWYNFTPSDIFLTYDYDNCSESRKVELLASTTFQGAQVPFVGNDRNGLPNKIKWTWTGNNVNMFSNDGVVFKDVVYASSNANPVTALFNNPDTLVQILCTTTFSVSTDVIDTFNPPPCANVTVNYDLAPLGFEVDFDLNQETASLLNGTFYRIVPADVYSVSYRGKVKPDNNTGWLTTEEVNSLPDADTKVYFYVNGDRSQKIGTGANAIQSFDLLSYNYHLSSITFEVSCLSASPAFGYGHTKSKTINLNIYSDSFIPDLSAVLFPEYTWLLPSTNPSVCSLYIEPELYWTYFAYPSAYGEGRSNVFLGSAFDATGDYDVFNWYVDNQSPQDTNLFVATIETEQNVEKTSYVTVGAFISSISLFNTELSTYKSDLDGTPQTFKNWQTIATPLINVLYDAPTGTHIVYRTEVQEGNNAYVYFNIDLTYPDYSPMAVNLFNTTIVWRASSDTGEIFDGETSGGDEFFIMFPAETTNIRTLYVNASARVAEYIPDREGYSFSHPEKLTVYEIPAAFPSVCAIPVGVVDFYLSSFDVGSILDNLTDTITAFSPVTLSGVGLTILPKDSEQWVFGTSSLSLDQPLVTSIEQQMVEPEDFVPQYVPIIYTVNSGAISLSRTKTLVIDPAIASLQWKITPDNFLVLANDTSFLYNYTVSPIPISAYYYQFDGETESAPLGPDELYFFTISSVGNKNLNLTAIDVKNHKYTTKINNLLAVVSAWETFSEEYFVGGETDLFYTFNDLKVKPNEWVVSDNINTSLEMIYDNLLYLEDISRFYAKPPYQLLGWYGYDSGQVKWNLFANDSDYNYIADSSSKLSDLVAYRIIDNDYVLLAYKQRLEVRSNKYISDLLEQKSERSINDTFKEIKNAVTDSEGKIILLDSYNFGTITVYEYNPLLRNPFKFIAKWGGLGSATSRTKFKNANDLSIDADDNLWVSDTGNRCVKKFTRTGGWLETLTSGAFDGPTPDEDGTVDNGSVISASGAKDGRTYALTNEYVVAFKDGVETGRFEWTTAIPDRTLVGVRITASNDDGMVYVVCQDVVLKFTKDGYFVGPFGEHPQEYDTNIPTVNYVNLVHYDSKVLHLVATNFVLKYSEFIAYLSIKPRLRGLWWQPEDLKINSEEFVEYWVYNKIFSRLWDNMDYFRQSLQARVLISKDLNGKTLYKIYKRYNDYKLPFAYKKEDIMIGVNELVTTDVVNRCLNRIHSCMLELLNMIVSQAVKYRWVDTIEIGVNPLMWVDTTQSGDHPVKWGDAVS